MFTMFFCGSGGGVLHREIIFSIDEHIKPERERKKKQADGGLCRKCTLRVMNLPTS